MDKTYIIFKMEYTHTNGWGPISNFITKFSENLPMKKTDVDMVSSCVLKGNWLDSNFSMVKALESDRKRFLSIRRPEKIYEDRDRYDYVFYISVRFEQLYDVVELQNLYLLLDSCEKSRILTLVSGTQREYYKTSHFFSFLTKENGSVYKSVFFKSDNIKHLQQSNIGVLSKFLPLLPVNSWTNSFLRESVGKHVDVKIIERYLKGIEAKQNVQDIFAGALRKLLLYRKKLELCDIRQCAGEFGKTDVLSFLLFCFSLEGNGKDFTDMGEVHRALQEIVMWTNGCTQLIENIVFHSPKKRGTITFRILDGEKTYVEEKYMIKDKDSKWIELMITDYPGCYHTLNIANKFCENLADDSLKKLFEDLTPRDFFDDGDNKKICEAWKQYYSEKKNVINHYGIKIFRNTVQRSGGHFISQSYSSHYPKPEELYCDKMTKNVPAMNLPGTGYSVLFPINLGNIKEKYIDYGVEDYKNKIQENDNIFDYKVIPAKVLINEKIVSAHGKEELIIRIAEELQGDKKKPSVISVNASEFRGDKAEIIYKAVILALLQSDNAHHVVMHGCQQEFVQMFLNASYSGYVNLNKGLHYKSGSQIVLYTGSLYEEIIILPESWSKTLLINRTSNFSKETRWRDFFEKWGRDESDDIFLKDITRYPFDILIEESTRDTIFEKYVETVVNRNIQAKELGCKIENTHMRLGSTIHVNHFYEAEILFGNSFFVDRFALLIIKRLLMPFSDVNPYEPVSKFDRITLYGYSNYSELVIFCTMHFLRKIFPEIDVDYAILERESADRGFKHVDRIRYSTYFGEKEEGENKRKNYFQSRKIISIIPIASTLKTNEKMINLFAEDNGKESKTSFWRNFELLLVGSLKENIYWTKKGKRILGKEGMEIEPVPEFFVEVSLEYMEPLKCKMCFPDHIIDEQPLIEVNATSTIPDQAFGLLGNGKETCYIDNNKLKEEEEKLSSLKNVLLYRHLERNENHFLFYFQTERLIVQEESKIREWLLGIKKDITIPKEDYVILFSPTHFSNAGFVECVNNYVFENAAVVIRDDVDKEYRCNFRTKFSNISIFAKKISDYNRKEVGRKYQMHFYYVDDAVITGHTFQRARSLVQSIIEQTDMPENRKNIVFDGIFVLVDRNSRSSRWQYTGVDEEAPLYAFKTIHISSVRNYGDACVYCNLAKEIGSLKRCSVTKEMEEYWEYKEDKFRVKSLSAYVKERDDINKNESGEEKKEKAFRRLVCTNNLMFFLKEDFHGNQKKKVLEQLLDLVLKGCLRHKGEEAEYFLSYCKMMSRPFRVFDKAVKEAVFDFLLLTGSCALSGKSYDEVINENGTKKYLCEKRIKRQLHNIERFIKLCFRSEKQQQDLIKVLIKQLTEMKSNFIMRKESMEQILDYAAGIECEKERGEYLRYYKSLLKKLTGIGSDTSKSLWMDQMLKENWEDSRGKYGLDTFQDIYLENAWIYQEAFQKLNERIKGEHSRWEKRLNLRNDTELKNEFAKIEEQEIEEYITQYQFKDFISLLQLYRLCGEDGGLTEDGKVYVASNFLLTKFISSEFGKALKSTNLTGDGELTEVDYIAAYMKYIMRAEEIIIIMQFDAEYDFWENEIIGRYNALLSGRENPETIKQEPKKEYIVLGSSGEKSGVWTFKEKKVIEKTQDLQQKEEYKNKGYLLELKNNIFLWELGYKTNYPVYVYARWEESELRSMHEVEILNRIRSGMQYYWLLNDLVFNKSNESFFYEITRQRKNNAIYSRRKIHTHTKNDIKLKQYNHMLAKEDYGKYYQSDILTLLADLNVSEQYRNSLTKEYYLHGVPFRVGRWNSLVSLFGRQRAFYVINSDMDLETELVISREVLFKGDLPLRENEEIVSLDYAIAEREIFLLIYSLMTNAAMEGRGLVKDNCVTVYCSRTPEGLLRIANEMGKKGYGTPPEQIMEELKYPPEEEEDGISLWSMSRYVKRIIAGILDGEIKEIKNKRNMVSEGELEQLRNRIFQMTKPDSEFQLSVTIDEVSGKKYFSVLIPILAEKYEQIRGGNAE